MATSSIRNDPPNPRDTDLHEHDPHDKLGARIAIVEEHVRLENAHDLEGVLGTFGDAARYDDEPWGEHFNGRDGVRQFYEQLMKALPDLQIEIQRRHVGDDAIILEVSFFMGKGRRDSPRYNLFTISSEGSITPTPLELTTG
ncbi:MAG TPA: nuclear transport factor 2 family protein [Terriglobales bacterium]|nr:nuclear transport factor 2 family protein [Terriglobales bacterium]